MSGPEDRWRIKEFAAAVGVPETTLRAWERRYALLQPERTAGGFRLYSSADERRVRAMQAHLERGIAAAQAAALAISEGRTDASPSLSPGALVEALVAAAEAFDATRFDVLFETAFARGRSASIHEVVLPLLREIGERWASDELSVAQEHFASQLVQRRLLTLASGWDVGRGPLALLACPSGERHTLGLICFGLLLADRGWRIAYLGEDTPIDEVTGAGTSLRPNVVVLCSVDPLHLERQADAIAELGRRHHTIVAGSGASADLAARLGVHHAGGGLEDAARALAEDPARSV